MYFTYQFHSWSIVHQTFVRYIPFKVIEITLVLMFHWVLGFVFNTTLNVFVCIQNILFVIQILMISELIFVTWLCLIYILGFFSPEWLHSCWDFFTYVRCFSWLSLCIQMKLLGFIFTFPVFVYLHHFLRYFYSDHFAIGVFSITSPMSVRCCDMAHEYRCQTLI